MASCITASAPASSLSGAAPPAHHAADGSVLEDFQNLQLSVRPLDVTAEKSKAVVCRSASRRPPTRQRSHQRRSQPTSESGSVATPAPSSSSPNHAAAAAAVSLHRVSRLCHQIHASAVRQAFGNIAAGHPTTTPMRRDADVATTAAPTAPTSVEIVELESSSSDRTNASLAHTNLVRTKSSSNEDIHILSQTSNSMNKSIEDLDDFQQLQTWRRTSKIRRSLQFPKQNKQTSDGTSKLVDIPESSVSVKKIKEELEKGRRLDTVLRNNSVDIEALDQILQTIPGGSNSDRNSEEGDSETNKKLKRNSFVTVESIQEVKGRLRRTSSPSSDIYKENCRDEEIDLDADYADDGIVVDEVSCSRNGDIEIPAQSKRETSRVRSYVYGMEAALSHNNAKPTGTCTGTGSLESRVKLVNGSNFSVKNEDWYNRRKSYGFEQVHATEDSSNCILKSKKQVESSTDSGICRSSEIVHKTTNNAYNENDSSVENDPGHKFNGWKEITTGQVKKLASTYDSSSAGDAGELKSTTTITIPIVKNNNVVDLPWYDHQVGGREIKRHSIAVDESRYVRRAAAGGGHPNQERKHRRTSLVSTVFPSSNSAAYFEALEDDATAVRRIKKVEFCKTEVHFAAESGKVNIVATDEKPPPTQNFRRRRRSCSSSGPLAEELLGGGGGRLPVLRFGDSSEEQNMFGVGDGAAGAATSPQPQRRHDADAQPVRPPTSLSGAVGVVTVNADSDNAIAPCQNDSNATAAYAATDANTDDLSENEIKGILKNKPIPYHLGQEAEPSPIVADPSSSDGESTKWGVKLRHVSKRHSPAGPEDPPSIWKSTVTVRNIYKNKEGEKEEDERQGGAQEIQKRLRSLRPTKKAVTDAEHRGYSTKINFGEGEAKVVEEEEGRQWERQGWLGNTTWPPVLEDSHLPPHKDSEQSLQKGLVVKIGTEDYHHAVRSKITTSGSSDHKPTTTTTKITIDLSKSPLPERGNYYSAHQRSHFKSTSLILSTIKDKTANKQHRSVEETKKIGRYQNQLRTDTPASLKTIHSGGTCPVSPRQDTKLHMATDDFSQVPNINDGLGEIYTTDGQEYLLNHKKNLEHTEQNLAHSYTDSGSSEKRNINSRNLEERAAGMKMAEYRPKNTTVLSSPQVQRSLPHPGQDSQNSTAYRRMLDCGYPNGDLQLKAGCLEMISNSVPVSTNDSLSVNCDQSLSSAKDNHAFRKYLRTTKNSSSRHDTKTPREGTIWHNVRSDGDDGEQTPLQMLKRLYEEAAASGSGGSDNDVAVATADNGVQRLSSAATAQAEIGPCQRTTEDECSVVSGSWSKMRAYRILWENRTKFVPGSSTSAAATAAEEKDSALAVHSRMVDTSNCSNNSLSTEATTSRDQEESRAARRGLSLIRNAESWPPVTPDLDSVEKLSSPSLVGRTGVDHHKLQPSRTTPDNIVLRQPKRSEMTYFGIKVSPSPKKKVSQATIRGETNLVSKKPDPLQHHAKSTSPTRCKYNKPRQKTPEPVYENIYPDKKYKGRELDASGILDELTKADDEILQAVNGYTDEDKKQSTDEEKQKLETIDEAKLWKRPSSSTNGTKPSNMKSKLKHTSSTSSVESITKKRAVEGKIARTTERQQQRSSQQSKKKKQDISDSSTSSKATAAANLKANRRLQRANSREALLHSHGSSSEDLPNRTEVTVRKPRLVKKTKAVQLTMSNGLEMKKKASGSTANVAARKKEDGKADESLPEIRHKTAFSTIRSTSERVTKDRAKYKHEDLKKKIPSKKDTTSRGAADAAQTCSDSKCNRTSPSTTKQCLTSGANGCGGNDVKATALPKGDRQHRSVGFGAGVPVVTQHRISTANIKKCCSSSSKFEGVKP